MNIMNIFNKILSVEIRIVRAHYDKLIHFTLANNSAVPMHKMMAVVDNSILGFSHSLGS